MCITCIHALVLGLLTPAHRKILCQRGLRSFYTSDADSRFLLRSHLNTVAFEASLFLEMVRLQEYFLYPIR
ncbi:hypothetical protein RB195_001957 [Necator americanus]|uniref:Secreted protein n=1 Tax=Necator americanus TaxID=51031 RepID=A0ABR1DHH6_NECAM